MIRIQWILAALMVLWIGSNAVALTLVETGQARAVIVRPDDADPIATQASELLQSYLKRASGAKLAIVSESDADAEATWIAIGPTKAAAAAALDASGLFADGYLMRVVGNRVLLVGRDLPYDESFPPSIGAKGTLRAAIGFLEDIVGVRWLIPSPNGDYVPVNDTIVVPDDLDKRFEPAFAYGIGRMLQYGTWSQANNFRSAIRVKSYGGHSWSMFIPDDLFETQPDLFNMSADGKRALVSFPGNRMHCGANPKTVELLIEGVRRDFDRGYDLVELGVSDGYLPCRCEVCESRDNFPEGPTDRIHIPHIQVAEALAKSHPGKRIMILAYPPTNLPPGDGKRYPDNTWVQLATSEAAPWEGKAGGFTRYAYVWGRYHLTGVGPSISPRQLQEHIRKWRDEKVVGVYFCGGDYNWGAEGPCYWIGGRLLGDPDQDVDELLAEYCQGVFGAAAVPMKQYFDLLYERVEAHATIGGLPDSFNNLAGLYTLLYPPLILGQLESKLDMARNLAGDDERALQWIDTTQESLTFLRDHADVFHLFRAYQINPGRETLTMLRDAVNRRHAHVDEWLAHAKDRNYAIAWLPGASRIIKYAPNHGNLQGSLTGPFRWDFDKLLETEMYPGKTRLRTVARRIDTPPVIDGRLDDAAWPADAWVEMGGVTGGEGDVETRFSVAHDGQTLYVAFDCGESKIGDMIRNEYVRDGKVWRNDSVELFFDHEGLERRFHHLIASPVDGAYYDARTGFIEDKRHPRYDAPDVSWNPEWTYAYQIDKDGGRWTIEIAVPLAALGIDATTPGETWRFNAARERRTVYQGEFMLWSPNFQREIFTEPSIFGELEFE